jgi:hypothetical protein
MKIILSRKGFDSSAGGCPSPIFPDGSMLALPIPDRDSQVRYQDLTWQGRNLGDLVPRLAGGKPRAHYRAHLDPDLIPAMRPRAADWRPVFGQRGPAQGHLRNNDVGVGDLFLFFGLFRNVTEAGDFIPGTPSRHILWGWLQVAEALPVDDHRGRLAWAGDHPHLSIVGDPSNTMYVASGRLTLPGAEHLPGAGVFGRFSPNLQLTAPGSAGPSTWTLPAWFNPEGRRSALSYHSKAGAWERCVDGVKLQTVGRGQEFVLNADDYPESHSWAASQLTHNHT